jgi:GNAT superfamily N-acetyltransferase
MTVTIRSISADDAMGLMPAFADLLKDAVDGGAGVNFMRGFSLAEAATYWQRQIDDFRQTPRIWLAAEEDGVLVGTVMCLFAGQPNQPYRGEVAKMLVHSRHRNRGIGARLMTEIEREAVQAGKSLLVLDTAAGSPGDRLYARMGWTRLGVVPDYAYLPDGTPEGAAFFYKRVAPVPVWAGGP